MIKVENHTGLYKDPRRNTFINMNKSEIESARERKKLRQKKKEEEKILREKVDTLTEDVSELKSMILQLLEK